MAEYDPDFYRTDKWFESLEWQQPWIHFMAGWWAGTWEKPKTVLDLGCGDGSWAGAFSLLEATVAGVELDVVAQAHIPARVQVLIHDLRQPLNLAERYDLVICLEVAEHLPKSAADNLCDIIGRHTKRYCLFSAAGPGQHGTGHVNLEAPAYWIRKMQHHGLNYNDMMTRKTQECFDRIVNDLYRFLPKNVMVFTR